MWGGMYPGENFIEIVKSIAEGKGVKEIIEYVEQEGKNGYRSINMNLVLADN